ncbi:MAG: GntR family transcriptional regulator [Chloroflexaceae bacterium]
MIQRQQLVDQVIERLRARIDAGEFPPGSRLPPEPQLMAELGVGRSTVREAVRALAHSGVLEVRQGDGTYVRMPGVADEPLGLRLRRAQVHEVHEVRRALELEIARLAALRRDEADLAALRAALAARGAALARGERDAALTADLALHAALADATHNRVLADLYRAFAPPMREALAALWAARESGAATHQLHADLVAAVAAGDPGRASAAAAAILDQHTDLMEGPGNDV